MLPFQRTLNFENVLVGKPNQIKKSFTQLWLLVVWKHGSSGSYSQSVSRVLRLELYCSTEGSGSRLGYADGFGARSSGKAGMVCGVSVWGLAITMAGRRARKQDRRTELDSAISEHASL